MQLYRLIIKTVTTADKLPVRIASLLKYLSLLFCTILPFNSAYSGILDQSDIGNRKVEAESFYQALVAEMSIQVGNKRNALDHYYQLSTNNNDPAIAKRVTELATVTAQIVKAQDAAKRWVEIAPNDLEANQYLSLLYLRNSAFELAAKQLDTIRSLIEKSSNDLSTKQTAKSNHNRSVVNSESLTFIGAMLASEAHHKKALKVYELFLANHFKNLNNYQNYQKQQKLIHAQLAMKAKAYSVVITALDNLTGLDEQNRLDAIVLHAKALHKTHQNTKAINLLSSIQNHPETKDSHLLELVRLLVLDKQKSKALPILKTLVSRHDKNLDLLKSLIALQIDQSSLSDVKQNLEILRNNQKYLHEARYLSGEFEEKLGQQELALASYESVTAGDYLKNAHKKRIALTKLIHGKAKLLQLFEKNQEKSKTLSDRAYWIKLQADDYFESSKYQKAFQLYDKAISLAPDKIQYRHQRGLVQERLGMIEKAEADFNFVLEKRANDTDTLNALGYMLSVHTSRFDEAKAYIEKAFKLKPNDPLILDSLGFVHYKKGELEKAEVLLRKAFQLSKKPEVASHLITVLAKLNQHQEAKSIFLEMQKSHPHSPSLKSVSDFLQ